MDTNEQVPEDGKDEVIKMIEDGVMKLLVV
jgi:hypothetical protein